MNLEGFKHGDKILVSFQDEWVKALYREDKHCKTLVKVYMLEGVWKGGELMVPASRVKRRGKKKAK